MPIGRPEEAFRRFLSSTGDIREITRSFRLLYDEVSTVRAGLKDSDENWYNDNSDDNDNNDNSATGCSGHRSGIELCEELCGRVNCQEAKTLLRCLTNRASHVEYERGSACRNTKVLIVGAGPCGLRMAIECALLGAESVDVIEMRSYLSRNNGLHLWPFVMDDLRRIGAKVFYPKFGSGSIDHISTKRLQEILLKIGLLLGVQVHAPVQFKSIIDPDPETGHGWRVHLDGEVVSKRLAEQEFDVMIAAAGAKRDVFPGFKRKCFRAKMAIAVTANFVNNFTTMESRVAEISGLAYIYHQEFFKDLKHTVGIDLENIVYYKGDTHYFVMTPKKACLLAKGVLRQDYQDSATLLSPENIDLVALRSFAREAADAATKHQLSAASLKFAKNHLNEDDVAAFDFTALHQAEHSCRVTEKYGRRLLLSIVGDVLLEPFWPIGSGIARGFLGVLDTAWLIRNWSIAERPPVELIAERESIFQLLSQTTPDNLKKNMSEYTINPITRYGTRLNLDAISTEQVERLHISDQSQTDNVTDASNKRKQHGTGNEAADQGNPHKKVHVDEKTLLLWFQSQLSDFKDVVQVIDLQDSWRNALALCAIVQLYRPDVINVRDLQEQNVESNARLAFDLIEREFHVVPNISASDLASGSAMDSLNMITYLFYIYQAVKNEIIPSSALPSQYTSSKSLDLLQSPLTNVTASRKLLSISTSRNVPRSDDDVSQEVSKVNTLYEPLTSNTRKSQSQNVSLEVASDLRSAKRKLRRLLKASSRSTVTSNDHVIRSSRNRSVRHQDPLSRPSSKRSHTSLKCFDKSSIEADPASVFQQQGPLLEQGDDTDDVETLITSDASDSQACAVHSSLAFCQGIATSKIQNYEAAAGIAEVEDEQTGEISHESRLLTNEESHNTTGQIIKRHASLVRSGMISGSVNNPKSSGVPVPRQSASSPVRFPAEKRMLEIDTLYSEPEMLHASLAFCKGIAKSKIQKFEVADVIAETEDEQSDPSVLLRRRISVKPTQDQSDVTDADAAATDEAECNSHPGKVSAVLSQLERAANDHRDKLGGRTASCQVCYSCSKPLYMIDKLAAHGYWFHHACFKCETCNNRLRLDTSMIKKEDNGTAKFYCNVHGYRAGVFDIKWQRKAAKDESILAGSNDGNVDKTTIESEAAIKNRVSHAVTLDQNDDVSDEPSEDKKDDNDNELSEDEKDNSDNSDDSDAELSEDKNDNSDDSDGELIDDDEYDNDMNELKNTFISKMILADELNDVRAEEDKADEQAQALEQTIRRSHLADSSELVTEWLETLAVRIVLAEREFQIVLQTRLTELRDRHANLSLQIKLLHTAPEETSQRIEYELSELTTQIADLQDFLDIHQTVEIETS